MHIRRTVLPATAALGMVALNAAPAAAHVTVSPTTTAAGAYAVLTVSVPHGCDGSATTRVAISMPEEIPQVTATRNPFWNLQVRTQPLPEPIEDAHGNQITEREAVVVYTAKQPLPDPVRDVFELSVQLPDAAGDTLVFPIVQTCEEGEAGWTEVAEEGQDPHDLEHPAPTVTVTEAEGDGHGEAHAETEADSDAATDDDGNGLALAGLGTGIAGIVVGGIALARSRKA